MSETKLSSIRIRYTDMIFNQKKKICNLKDKLSAEEYLMKELEKEKKLLNG